MQFYDWLSIIKQITVPTQRVCVSVCVRVIFTPKSWELVIVNRLNWLNFLLLSHNDHNINVTFKTLEKWFAWF